MVIKNCIFTYCNHFNQSIFAYCYQNDYNNRFSRLKLAKLIAIKRLNDYDETITTERRALLDNMARPNVIVWQQDNFSLNRWDKQLDSIESL